MLYAFVDSQKRQPVRKGECTVCGVAKESCDRALGGIDELGEARPYRVPLSGFDLFIQLSRQLLVDFEPVPSAPWLGFHASRPS